ncbi:hypothetical protein WJX75_005289 [Coccomyxa subellipsoidea]|uniref:Uncharacterized protein n=1 Tax=Coccomyxa subellipsoidea TaxID=248742 RepID=A0ABR2YGD8_9CHLO
MDNLQYNQDHLLRTRRRPEELPVLTRWFPAVDVEVPEAKFLDVILYSREQLGIGSRDAQAYPGSRAINKGLLGNAQNFSNLIQELAGDRPVPRRLGPSDLVHQIPNIFITSSLRGTRQTVAKQSSHPHLSGAVRFGTSNLQNFGKSGAPEETKCGTASTRVMASGVLGRETAASTLRPRVHGSTLASRH